MKKLIKHTRSIFHRLHKRPEFGLGMVTAITTMAVVMSCIEIWDTHVQGRFEGGELTLVAYVVLSLAALSITYLLGVVVMGAVAGGGYRLLLRSKKAPLHFPEWAREQAIQDGLQEEG